MNIASMTLLSICNEMDVKGTMSGKSRIFNPDGTACDILGHMLLRLGYRGAVQVSQSIVIHPDGRKESAYMVASRELGIPRTLPIWLEIDREKSTNETIRQKVKEICGHP